MTAPALTTTVVPLLSPREQVIVLISAGLAAQAIADDLGIGREDIREVGRPFGWPKRKDAIEAAARAILHGDSEGEYVGALPGLPWPVPAPDAPEGQPSAAVVTEAPTEYDDATGCISCEALDRACPDHGGMPTDLDRDVDRADELEHAAELRAATQGRATDALLLEETAAVLGILDRTEPQSEARTDRALLTMPLVTLLDADGTRTVVRQAVVEVTLDGAGVLRALEDGAGIVERGLTASVWAEVPPDAVTAVRALWELATGATS